MVLFWVNHSSPKSSANTNAIQPESMGNNGPLATAAIVEQMPGQRLVALLQSRHEVSRKVSVRLSVRKVDETRDECEQRDGERRKGWNIA